MGERNTILIKVELLPSKIWKANVIERQPLVTVHSPLFVWFSVFFFIFCLFVCFKLTLYYSLNESNSFKFYVVYLVILVRKLSETVVDQNKRKWIQLDPKFHLLPNNIYLSRS